MMVESDNDGVEYFAVADLGDLDEDGRIFFEMNGNPVVIIKAGDTLYAFDDRCTHDDGPLGDGDLEGCEIICPRHGARFDIRSGEALTPPAADPVQTYPVRVSGSTIEIGIKK